MEKIYKHHEYADSYTGIIVKLRLFLTSAIEIAKKTYMPYLIIMILAAALCFNHLIRSSLFDLITFII